MFRDRVDAGRQLGQRLALALRERSTAVSTAAAAKPLVLGLPRGGVVVAAEVAQAITAPLDVFVVRKIGAPFHSELALGAVADVNGQPEIVLNHDMLRDVGVDESYIRSEAEAEHAECLRRLREYRGDRAPPIIANRVVIVVDDGIATGATIRAALQVLRRQNPRSLTLAVPVAPDDVLAELRPLVDGAVCLSSPAMFSSVGRYYEQFDQTSDEEVNALLKRTD